MSKVVYRYFSHKYTPSEIIPIGDIINVVDYDKPIDLGDGKIVYGYIDYSIPVAPANADEYGLEYAPVNPVSVQE